MRYIERLDEVTVVAARDLTPGKDGGQIREIVLETPWTAPHAPGAHIDVELILEGRVELRSYSLVGEAEGTRRKIAVRLDPASRGGSKAMHALKPGQRLKATPPSNSFELALDAPAYLLVAGGVGVTPIVQMASALVKRGARVSMLYAGRSREEMAYLAELQDTLREGLSVWADAERDGPPDLASAFSALPKGGQTYICGPIPMLEAAKRAWAEQGRPLPDLRFETFGSSGRLPNKPFTVHLPDAGLSVQVPADRSILESLEAAGLEVMNECRRGECGLCTLTVVPGEDGRRPEIDHRDVFLSEAQRAANDRLCVCVSRAAGGEITLESGLRKDKTPEFSKVFAAAE